MKNKDKLLLDSNNIIRSFSYIIERKGLATNWDGIGKEVKRILKEQHKEINRLRRKEKIIEINAKQK